MLDLEAKVWEGALKKVLEHIGAQVSDMSVVIDCGSAAVEAYLARLYRDKVLYFASHGVK
jgi:hypothetical protein